MVWWDERCLRGKWGVGSGEEQLHEQQQQQQCDPRTVVAVRRALAVLAEPCPYEKARLTREYYEEIVSLERDGALPNIDGGGQQRLMETPAKPNRSDLVEIVDPRKIKGLGKGGSLRSRMAICHSLAHIESWAIDLSWDIIARFAISQMMPFGFVCDFARVALDEASHFERLAERLKAMGGSYGDLPAHDGLWESATETSDSLMARLAVEHMVHEARGLDVLPQTISKFEKNGDKETALVLRDFVYPEEVTHCAAGLKYFCYLYVRDHAPKQDGKDTCLRELEGLAIDSMSGTRAGEILSKSDFNIDEVIASFHSIVRRHFHGRLKPPFNDEAREKAGFTKSWYLPLATE